MKVSEALTDWSGPCFLNCARADSASELSVQNSLWILEELWERLDRIERQVDDCAIPRWFARRETNGQVIAKSLNTRRQTLRLKVGPRLHLDRNRTPLWVLAVFIGKASFPWLFSYASVVGLVLCGGVFWLAGAAYYSYNLS